MRKVVFVIGTNEDANVVFGEARQCFGDARPFRRNAGQLRRVGIAIAVFARRKVVLECNADLMQVALALRSARTVTDVLNRGHENRHERANNGNNDQQLDERETAKFSLAFLCLHRNSIEWRYEVRSFACDAQRRCLKMPR
jgi:hypothetical protein